MEDHFLYKLRNGQLQNNNINYRSKKVLDYKRDGSLSSDSNKQLGKLMEKMLDFQKDTLTCLERITTLQDRQSKAMLKVANTLKLFNESIPMQKKNNDNNKIVLKSVSKNETLKGASNQEKKNRIKGLAPTDEKILFETIKSMRSNDQTWNFIADYLKKEKISTLTGNGTWSPNLALYFYKKMLSQNSKT